jgi:hypothetical protein
MSRSVLRFPVLERSRVCRLQMIVIMDSGRYKHEGSVSGWRLSNHSIATYKCGAGPTRDGDASRI